MNTTGKRLLAVILAVLMLFTTFPAAALAALIDNDPAYNREILDALTEVAGSEDAAEDFYKLMQQYNLLDEDGNAVESWSIRMDGKNMTLDELREVLAGDYNPDDYVWVDGTPVTLEDVNTMIQIEDSIAYLRETYFTEKEWTPEQIENYQSLMRQLKTGGITLNTEALQNRGGYDGDAVVYFTNTTLSGDHYSILAALSDAEEGQEVTFDWTALPGSRPASGSGSVRLVANADGAASAWIEVPLGGISPDGENPVQTAGNTYAFVYCNNLTNAHFLNSEGGTGFYSTTLYIEADGSVEEEAFPTADDINMDVEAGYTDITIRAGEGSGDRVFNAIQWGLTDRLLVEPILSRVATCIRLLCSDQNARFQFPVHLALTTGFTLAEPETISEEYDFTYQHNRGTSEFLESGPTFEYALNRPNVNADGIVLSSAKWMVTYPAYEEYNVEAQENTQLIYYNSENFPVSYHFSDNIYPRVTDVSLPSVSFQPGDIAPVVVTFSEPVENAKLTVDGETLEALEDGATNVATFLYTVGDKGVAGVLKAQLSATDIVGHELVGGLPTAGFAGSGINHGARVSCEWVTDNSNSYHDSLDANYGYVFTLTGAAPGQQVSFDVQALQGTQLFNMINDADETIPEGQPYTVTMTADSNGFAETTLRIVYLASNLTYLETNRISVSRDEDDPVVRLYGSINCTNIRNALFVDDADNTADRMTLPLQFKDSSYAPFINGSFTLPADDDLEEETSRKYSYSDGIVSHVKFDYNGAVADKVKQLLAGGCDFVIVYPEDYPDIFGLAPAEELVDTYYDFFDVDRQEVGNPGSLQTRYTNRSLFDVDVYEASPMIEVFRAEQLEQLQSSSAAFVFEYDLPAVADRSEKHIRPFYADITDIQEPKVCVVGNGYSVTSSEIYLDQISSDFDDGFTFTFSDNRAPRVESITAPQGVYRPGDTVLFKLTLSEPAQPDTVTLTLNHGDGPMAPLEQTESKCYTFAYVVKEPDTGDFEVTDVTAKDLSGKSLTWTGEQSVPGVQVAKPDPAHAIEGVTLRTSDDPGVAALNVEVQITSNEALTDWLDNDLAPSADGRSFVTQSLQVSVDGERFYPLTLDASAPVTGGTLTASVPATSNTGDSDTVVMAELYLTEEDGAEKRLLVGKYGVAAQSPATLISDDDIKRVWLTVDGEEYNGDTVYIDDAHEICAHYRLGDKNYQFPNDIVWSSSDENVAVIDADGKIIPIGSGSVSFRLQANNNGLATAGKQSGEITFGMGLTPFLLIPNNNIRSAGGRPVTVYWSTNLCDKVEAPDAVSFSFAVRRGGSTVHTATLSGNKANRVSSATIPADVLYYDYSEGAVNSFSVTVSAVYNGTAYNASAVVTLEPSPATVRLRSLSSNYILDTAGSVEIGWDITSFNRFSSADASELFRLLITKGSETVFDSNDPGAGGSDGRYSGSYTLRDLAFNADSSQKNSYRQVYTVTIQAKNGEDNTWSYDSYLLYVYDADSLKIWVDGEDQDSVTMTNVPMISQMTQEEILALKRDITLRNVISANYGEYAWLEVADRIEWASSNNAAATVNYRQGTLYEDIANLSYVSYRPTTDFVLSGLSDGQTTVTARHFFTGMTDSLDVTVETLKDKLYLFQCYPQVTTTLTYTDSDGVEKTVTSDEKGAAAIYEENGIQSDVYCRSTGTDGNLYLGTFYLSALKTGERDSTKLQLYPCNNLQLRRAAYAYLYLKNPDGTPYTGEIIFRGGVYVNNEYKENAKFSLNSNALPSLSGAEDQTVSLDSDGRLTVVMDQTQWDLPHNEVDPGDKVRYVFLIKVNDGTFYYPVIAKITATINLSAYVKSGAAVINFRRNDYYVAHPFVLTQTVTQIDPGTNKRQAANVRDNYDCVGPNEVFPVCDLTTVTMWWGESSAENGKLRLVTDANMPVAENDTVQENGGYPFIDEVLTTHTATLSWDSLKDTTESGEKYGLALEYMRDGKTLSRKESLSIRLCNLLNLPDEEEQTPEESPNLSDTIANMGLAMGTSAETDSDSLSLGDEYVKFALEMMSTEGFTDGRGGFFSIRISPTSDPTKFLGFVEVNAGPMDDASPTMALDFGEDDEEDSEPDAELSGDWYQFDLLEQADTGYTPDWDAQMAVLSSMGHRSADPLRDYASDQLDSFKTALKGGDSDKDANWSVAGYLETMIYYDYEKEHWDMRVLDGGFMAGGELGYSWLWNWTVGPVPVTMELHVGAIGEIGMDAITAAYLPEGGDQAELGTEFLTRLRIRAYLKLFAGLGFDYSLVAVKLGIFGQITVDMGFSWLNRPYLSKHDNATLLSTGDQHTGDANLDGQSISIDGEIGLQLVLKFLFFSFEQTLFSFKFNAFNTVVNEWNEINDLWEANQENLQDAIEALLEDGSASLHSVGGRQMMSLNMAPALESRDYLDDGGREWNTPAGRKGLGGLFKAPARPVEGVSALQTNAYPYADPELTRDGNLLVYLTDQNSADVTKTRAAFTVKQGGGYAEGSVIDNGGYGDSQLTVDGDGSFAVSAWTRQTVTLNKDAGAAITNEDQMMMLDGTEIVASVYEDGVWHTARLTDNSGADVAPTAATNGDRAVVAWRSVVAGDAADIMNFDRKDTILYCVYENGAWSEPMSLYNGTGGAVKGIASSMMDNGTAAVAYTLDLDGDDTTASDREIVYAVVGADNEVTRNVRATTDEKLDENPQLAAVTFPSDTEGQRFVLGWFSKDTQDAEGESDIRLFDFDGNGVTGQLMPESLSQATHNTEVKVTSNFRFCKNADSIEDLSIIWVERDEGEAQTIDVSGSGSYSETTDRGDSATEKDVLKGVKFYTYGQNSELIAFTGALNIADMPDATLIDHFDAYSNGGTQITAAVLGTTYGKDGATAQKTGETVSGTTVTYTVPKAVSAMYTAVDNYEDKIEVPMVSVDYETVKLDSRTQVLVSVRNAGVHAISKLTVKIGGNTTTYTELNLLPGNTLQVWADYEIPADRVVDADYTVTARFAETGNKTAAGTVYLDYADVQITDAKIMEEEEGQRVIQIKLYNSNDAALAGSGRSVKLRFFSDPTHETEIANLPAVTISSDADLAMIDEGGYSKQVTFDVAAFVKGDSARTVEIPSGGVPVYIMAEVIREGELDAETNFRNNYASVTCDNLKARTGMDVTLNSDFNVTGEGDAAQTTVTVNMQNTRLGQAASGNLIVTLLDEDGRVVDVQQSYDSAAADNGFITLGGEAKGTYTFTFDTAGADAQVTYSDVILDLDSVNLSSVYFSNVPGVTIDSFRKQDDGAYTAEATVDDMISTAVMAVAESGRSTVAVKVDDGEYFQGDNKISQDVPLTLARRTKITVTVTAENGDTRNYVLTVLSRKSINVYADAKEKIYGDDDPTFTWRAPGLVGDDTLDVTFTRDEGRDVGTYAIHGEIAPVENYIPTFVEADLTIKKRMLYITADPQTKVYGEGDPDLTWQISNVAYDDEIPVTLVREPGENVGSYKITTDVDASKNYIVSFTGANLTITPKTISVTADPKAKTYGAADPELTYTVTGLVGEDAVTGGLAREPGENIGAYAITQGTLDAGDNYVIDYTGADLTVAEKVLNIIAHPQSKFYGENDPALTYTVEGLEYDDTVTVGLVRAEGETAGTYPITLDTLTVSENYAVNYTSAVLTINPKAVTVTADAAEKIYGDRDPELTWQVEGLLDGEEITVTLSRQSGENVGTYAINAEIDAGVNYDVTYVPADLTIKQRFVVLIIHPKCKREGEQDPEFKYYIVDKIAGDKIEVTLTREPGEEPGRYPITAEVDAGPNYKVAIRGGSLTIEPNECPLCGKLHDGNVFDHIVDLLHRFIYRIKSMFGMIQSGA